MQQMKCLLVASVVAIGAQSAIAGGLPETKTTDSTSAGSGNTQATTASTSNSTASTASLMYNFDDIMIER